MTRVACLLWRQEEAPWKLPLSWGKAGSPKKQHMGKGRGCGKNPLLAFQLFHKPIHFNIFGGLRYPSQMVRDWPVMKYK